MTARESFRRIAVIGGGPAGLAAAERLAERGLSVTVYEAMPTVGRKFLMAGKSGLNLTHSEEYASFATRFGAASGALAAALAAFPPDELRHWADGLGADTFVGTSGRVFPKAMKASPLLRAWLRRLETRGVAIRTRHRLTGLSSGTALFEATGGTVEIGCDAILLALGGASWPRLGSDAGWVPLLRRKGVAITQFTPANCGFDVNWSETFIARFAGHPVKAVTATAAAVSLPGEFVISRHGVEGSLVYQHAAALRDEIRATGRAVLTLDLAPGRSLERLTGDLARQDTKASFANRLRKGAGIDGVKAGLLREVLPEAATLGPSALAGTVKALPLSLARPRPIAEAISSAGGIAWGALDRNFMLTAIPGVFCAGEMIDWEAPTGGYLLTACFATGRAAADGIAAFVEAAGAAAGMQADQPCPTPTP